MTDEDAKDFLRLHRDDIGNKHRIGKLSKRIRCKAAADRQQRSSERKIESSASSSQAKTPSKIVKTSPEQNADSAVNSSARETSTSPSEFDPPPSASLPKSDIINSDVVAALDRCLMTNEQTMMVLSPVVVAMGQKLDNTELSISTIKRRRKSHRVSIDTQIRNNYDSGGSIITVHYDGKKIKTQNGMDDRLAINVSSFKGCKLLAIPTIPNGRGKTIANTVFETLSKWDLIDNVRAFCFDTTASNTGWKKGSAPILSKMMPNQVLFLACRHHVAELLLAKIFGLTVEPETSAPTIGIFKRLKTWWENHHGTIVIDFKKIKENSVINDVLIGQHFPKRVRDDLVKFARLQLKKNHSRADYKEFAHLALLCLGETPIDKHGKPIDLKSPGAVSRARFMGKAIYSMKMYLLRDQFTLSGILLPLIFILCKF